MTSRLSAKILRRAIDLLVIGWLVAVGVTTGRQFQDWWRADDTPPSLSNVDAGQEWMSRPLDISIGSDGVSLRREPFSGSREEATQRLSEILATIGRDVPDPIAPADDAERGLLQSLPTLLEPPSTGPQTHVLSMPMPAVVQTRSTAQGPRLVAQGFAMPVGDQLWTLFVLPRGKSAVASPLAPTSMAVLLSWSEPQGNAVSAVRGDSGIQTAIDEFDQLYGSNAAVIREVNADSATLRYATDGHTIDVHLQPDGTRGWHGVIWKAPRTN